MLSPGMAPGVRGTRTTGHDTFNGHRGAVFGPVVRRSVSPSPLRHQGVKSVNTSENPKGRPSSTPPARLTKQSSKSSSKLFDNDNSGIDYCDPFNVQPQPATEFHSLPTISTIRRRITGLKDEEDLKQLRARVSFLLMKARGEICDWYGTSPERLRMLPTLLYKANMASELTRLLSDPLYLEVRLRTGTLSALLADFDICDLALNRLVSTEPIERRSSESSSALSRRHHVADLRRRLEALGALGMPVRGAGGQLLVRAAGWDMPLGLVSLTTALANFVAQAHEFLDIREDAANRPCQMLFALAEEDGVGVAGIGGDGGHAAPAAQSLPDGLRKDLANALSVAHDRLAVALLPSRDDEGQAVAVTILPPPTARGAHTAQIWQRLADLAQNPHSALYRGKSAGLLRLLDAEDYGSPLPAESAMADLRRVLGFARHVQRSRANGLLECLSPADQAEADRLDERLRVILCHNSAAARGQGRVQYRLCCGLLPGNLGCRGENLAGLAAEMASAASVPAVEVSLELLSIEVDEVEGSWKAVVHVSAPVADLHKRPKIHQHWMSKYDVSDVVPCGASTLILLFARPLSEAEADRILPSILRLKDLGLLPVRAGFLIKCCLAQDSEVLLASQSGSIELQKMSISRRVFVFKTETPPRTDNDWQESLLGTLKGMNEPCKHIKEIYVYLPNKESLCMLSAHAQELLSQECLAESLLCLPARVGLGSQERALQEVLFFCARVHGSTDQPDIMDWRLIFLEAEAGSGCSTVMAQVCKNVLAAGGLAIFISKCPSLTILEMLKFMVDDINMQLDCAEKTAMTTSNALDRSLVAVVDGCHGSELHEGICTLSHALSGFNKSSVIEGDLAQVFRRCIDLGFFLSIVVSGERFEEEACSELEPSSIIVIQLEELSVREQVQIIRARTAALVTGSVTGNTQRLLKAFENFLSRRSTGGSRATTRAVTPEFLVRALQLSKVMCPTVLALDDSFPGDILQVCDAILRSLAQSVGSSFLSVILRILLNEQVLMSAKEIEQQFDHSQAKAVRQSLERLAPLFANNTDVNSCFCLPQPCDNEVCSFLFSVRARIYSIAWFWAMTQLESSCVDETFFKSQSPFLLSETLLSIVSGEDPFAAEHIAQSRLAPRCPRALKICNLTSNSGVVAWEYPVMLDSFAGSFQIHCRIHGKPYQNLSARTEKLRCQLGDMVVPGAPTSCRVSVRFEDGPRKTSAWRVVTFQAPEKLCSPALQPVDVTSNSIIWTWSSPDALHKDGDIVIEGFRLEVEVGGVYSKIYEGQNTNYFQKNLKPNHQYTVRVCSYNSIGTSDWTCRSVRTKLCRSQLLQSASRLISGSLKKYTAAKKTENELASTVELAVNVQFSSGDPDSSGLWECATDASFTALPFLLLSEKKLDHLHKLVVNPVYLLKYIEKQGVHSLYHEILAPAKTLVNTCNVKGQETLAKDILEITAFIEKHMSELAQGQTSLLALQEVPLAIKITGESIMRGIVSESKGISEVREDGLKSWEVLRKLRHALDLKLYSLCDDAGVVKDESLRSALHLEEMLILSVRGANSNLENLVACANIDDLAADKDLLMERISTVLEAESFANSKSLDNGSDSPSYLKVLLNWDLSALSVDQMRQRRGDLLDKCLGKKESLAIHCVRLAKIKYMQDYGASSMAIICFEKSCVSKGSANEIMTSFKAAESLVELWQDSSTVSHSILSNLGVISVRHLKSHYLVVCMALPINFKISTFQEDLCSEIAFALCLDLNAVQVHRVTSGCYALLEVDYGSSSDVSDADLILDKLRAKNSPLLSFIISIQVIRQALPPILPGEQASIKVFNSSTFSDMHAERDLLNQLIYPAVRVYCMRRRVDFSWIDFRWGGVTEEDSSQHLAVLLCLDKVDECVISVGEYVSIPVLVGMVGERVGWVPAPSSADRQVVYAKHTWSKSEEYDRYSVTALEMAYAFLRQPQSSESFFFLRERKFMDSQAFKTQIPPSARQAFVEPPKKGRDMTTTELKRLIVDRAAGRWTDYSVRLCEPPFSFSTRLALSKVKELRKDLNLAARYFSGKSAPSIARVMALKREIMQWWLLLREQLDFQALAGSEVPDADMADVKACVADPFFSSLGYGEGDAGCPALGNSNVSAHGVRLDATEVGVAVGRCMRALVSAYFPHPAPLAAQHSHFLARAMQEARVEDHAQPFAGDARLRLVDWLVAEAVGVRPQALRAVQAVLLKAGPGHGASAVLSAVVSRLLPLRDGEPGPAGSRAILFFTAAPGGCRALEEAYRYLAAELSLQHRGKAGLDEPLDPGPAGESGRDGFVRAVRLAASDGVGRLEGLVLVADGLAEKDQLALLAAVRTGVEALSAGGATGAGAAQPRRAPFAATCILGPVSPSAATPPQMPVDGSGGEQGPKCEPSAAVRWVTLEPLSEGERAAVCRAWMRCFGKENPSERVIEIAVGKGCGDGQAGCVLPAYLALFCLEASTVGLFEGLDYELGQMPDDLCGLWRDRTLPRLELAFGSVLVQSVMRQLLAHRRGVSVDALRAVCLRDPDLSAQRQGLAARLERLIDALPPFLRRPGPCRPPRDLLLLQSHALIEATKARYAPCLLHHERRLATLTHRRLADAVSFRRTRGAVIEAPVAPFHKPPPPPRRPDPEPAAQAGPPPVPPQEWSFDPSASHRDLRPAGGDPPSRMTKMGGSSSACTAVVAPAVPPDRESYIEIRLDGPAATKQAVGGAGGGAGGQYPIRIGVMHATATALRRVRDGVAAGSLRGAYLFNCANGNLQTGGAGYSFVQAACGRDDCVGLRVFPARGEAVLYLNAARVGPLPIHAHTPPTEPTATGAPSGTAGGGRLDWSQLRFVVDLESNGQSVSITGRPCPPD